MKRLTGLLLPIILLACIEPVHSQSFDDWFTEGVMRVDLVFTGTAETTDYALSGIRKEKYYSGSKQNLIDPFDYGDHQFLVRDAASGRLIFRHTYCTLFREWQTTAEADTLKRAFHHVVRFPWPKEKVILEVHDRNEEGKFQSTWSGLLDPSTPYADPGNPQPFETLELEINGPPETRVDILFLAEGYTEEEMDKFITDVKRSADFIFSEEPFKSNRKAFNIRAVKSISADCGPDVPGQGIWNNTVLNATFYTFGVERYMTTLDYSSVCNVASNAHYDQIYILVNTSKYGGGGIYNHYSISAADNENSREVLIHEFGHAFAGLADEYYNSEVAYIDYFNLEAEPWNPNLTTLVDFSSKWEDLVGENTPVPTPPLDKYRKTVGVYEGGGYVSRGVYRPMIDCRMHSNDAFFCPVCSRAIERMIRHHTGD